MSESSLLVSSPAKLNLRLIVTGQRDDGYHLLSMWNAPLSLEDQVLVKVREEEPHISVAVSGAYSKGIAADQSNLAWKAAQKFIERSDVSSSVDISITKNIPHGGGLGGGSSNAAAVLKGLNTLFGNPINEEELFKLGLELGADVPFSLANGYYRTSGIGEELEAFDSSFIQGVPIYLFIGIPGISTKEVFKRFHEEQCSYSSDNLSPPTSYQELINGLKNDLVQASRAIRPKLGSALDDLQKIFGVRAQMTGSGSTLYCLPESPDGFTAKEQKIAHYYALAHNLTLNETAFLKL